MKKLITVFFCLAGLLANSAQAETERERFIKITQCNGAPINIRQNYLGELTQVAVLVEHPELKKRIKTAIRPYMLEVAKRLGPTALEYAGNDIRFYLSDKQSLSQFQGQTMNYGGAPDYLVTRAGSILALEGQFFSYVFKNCQDIR